MTPTPREVEIERPPLGLATVNADIDRGLHAALDEAMPARYRGATRKDVLGRLVMAVSRWRWSFRDCGCWRTPEGFSLCAWHEELFRSQREEAERAGLRFPVPPDTGTAATRLRRAIDAAIENIAHGRTGAAQWGLRAARKADATDNPDLYDWPITQSGAALDPRFREPER